jgi:chaperonin GroES
MRQHGPGDRSIRHDELGLQGNTVGRTQREWLTEHAERRYRPGVSLQSPDQKNAITMLSDRVLVQIPVDGERTSRAGILIPATAQVARRLSWAEVVTAGPLVRSVSVGDQVLFHRDEAFEVEVRGEEYLILRERDIHAVASPKNSGEGTGLYL